MKKPKPKSLCMIILICLMMILWMGCAEKPQTVRCVDPPHWTPLAKKALAHELTVTKELSPHVYRAVREYFAVRHALGVD
jgi:hypothetical protein